MICYNLKFSVDADADDGSGCVDGDDGSRPVVDVDGDDGSRLVDADGGSDEQSFSSCESVSWRREICDDHHFEV